METKELIEKTKNNFSDIFSERINSGEILLEEIKFENDGSSRITFSFFERNKADTGFLPQLQPTLVKVYKILHVDKDGKIEKIENYD